MVGVFHVSATRVLWPRERDRTRSVQDGRVCEVQVSTMMIIRIISAS